MSEEYVKTKVRRSVRIQQQNGIYKEILELLKQVEFKPTETLEAINDILLRADAVLNSGTVKERSKGAPDLVIDAHVYKMCCDAVTKATRSMANNEFNDEELVGVILSSFDPEQGIENWEKITREAASVFRMTKHSQSLYGTFEHEPEVVQKEPKQRIQRQKADFGQAKKPETVDKLQRKEKSAQALNLIFNQIQTLYEQRRKPIPYYQLIIDPEDFMNTVDNAFQISFLIRDGRIALLTDKNHDPLVRPTTEQENEQAKRMNETTQAILGLNPRKWREMIERFQIDEPMLFLNREELNATQSQK